jgi:hypothetical protein
MRDRAESNSFHSFVGPRGLFDLGDHRDRVGGGVIDDAPDVPNAVVGAAHLGEPEIAGDRPPPALVVGEVQVEDVEPVLSVDQVRGRPVIVPPAL